MTEEQKEILIAKMLDSPSSLSDMELDSILHDDELRDIYEASAVISNAYIRQPDLNMKAEWDRFRPRIRRKPSIMRWAMRVAAIFLGVLFVSSIVVRMIDKVFSDEQPSTIAKIEQSFDVNSQVVASQDPQEADVKKEEVENESAVIKSHPSTANRNLAKATPARTKTTTLQPETEIDIDEYLRVQQARIDNDLAMQAAELYIEEYDDLAAILDATGTYNPQLDNMIKKVTME